MRALTLVHLGLLAAVFTLCLSLLSYGTARLSLQNRLNDAMTQALPPALGEALVNADDTEALMAHARSVIERSLTDTPLAGALLGQTLGQCQPAVVDMAMGEGGLHSVQAITIRVEGSEAPILVSATLSCEPGYGVLLLQGLVPSVVLSLLLVAVPAPMSARRRQWFRWLVGRGESDATARRWTQPVDANWCDAREALLRALIDAGLDFTEACERAADDRALRLSDSQRQWLALGCRLEQGPDPWHVALSEGSLSFDIDAGIVTVHGVPVPLSRTPMLYYAWYARARQHGDGWITNPPSNRPDRAEGQSLAAFMEDHNGHGRAITELSEKGLRAKTLDQNRNRIKEELVNVLGEALAAPYLFDSERCGHVARFRYRLRLPPGNIEKIPIIAVG